MNPPRYKSALCQNFEKFGSCGYQDNCEFAHGRQVDQITLTFGGLNHMLSFSHPCPHHLVTLIRAASLTQNPTSYPSISGVATLRSEQQEDEEVQQILERDGFLPVRDPVRLHPQREGGAEEGADGGEGENLKNSNSTFRSYIFLGGTLFVCLCVYALSLFVLQQQQQINLEGISNESSISQQGRTPSGKSPNGYYKVLQYILHTT